MTITSANHSSMPLTHRPSGQEKTLYTVQVGAFSYLENARFRLEEAQIAGFDDAYIYEKKI